MEGRSNLKGDGREVGCQDGRYFFNMDKTQKNQLLGNYSNLKRFSTWRICSREQRKKRLDWLETNTDDIASQSHSLFACSPSGGGGGGGGYITRSK